MARIYNGVGWERHAQKIGALYCWTVEDTKSYRLGMGEREPKIGDLCLCLEYAGDCFCKYAVIRKTKDGKWKKSFKFGAYDLECPDFKVLPDKKFEELKSGKEVELPQSLEKWANGVATTFRLT